MIRIVIADDHPVVRTGLHGMLSGQADFEVVGEASDGAEAVALAQQLAPDVVLIDLRMPNMDGVAAIAAIRRAQPRTYALVLTTYDTDDNIVAAVAAGAAGFLLKDTSRETLFGAIRAAARGEAVLAPAVATRLIGRAQAVGEPLSARETEVLGLVARGHSNKQVAGALRISQATVKTHLVHIFDKLGVEDRTAAVTRALERGLIRLSN